MRRLRRQFGTLRGLVRLLLAYLALGAGRLDGFRLRRPEQVRRLVFVCQGNICRSAFAAQVADRLGLANASFGLATCTGAAAPAEACGAAQGLGYDLRGHRALDWADFKVMPGDLFLAMEVRQARELQDWLGGRADVAITLLGFWCRPVWPHLHDPFTLGPDYFGRCYTRVAQAVERLAPAVPQVRPPVLRRDAPAGTAV